MAQLDVSEVLTDPMFLDPFIIIRRTSTVTDFGRNDITEEQINAIGSVQAADGDTLAMLPEAARLSDVRNIFTRTVLIADVAGGYPDLILWKGNRYQTLKVTPWGNYGSGWYKCTCVDEKASL